MATARLRSIGDLRSAHRSQHGLDQSRKTGAPPLNQGIVDTLVSIGELPDFMKFFLLILQLWRHLQSAHCPSILSHNRYFSSILFNGEDLSVRSDEPYTCRIPWVSTTRAPNFGDDALGRG
jgi:hypothetical protein